jgi:hypothetical protein
MIIIEGHPARENLDAIYARIEALRAEIQATESAPIPHAETRERIAAALRALPQPSFMAFAEPGARYARLPVDERDTALSLDVWLHGVDFVLERAMRDVEAKSRPVGLPAAERQQRLEELRAEVAKAWRASEIEALRIEAECDGDIVDRRGDADPEVLLAVWGERGPALRSTGGPAAGPKAPRGLSDMGAELNTGAGLSAPDDFSKNAHEHTEL